MRVIDKILTRHFVAFTEALLVNDDYKTSIASNANVLKCAVASGIVEGLTAQDIDEAEPFRFMPGGDLAELAVKASDMVADSVRAPNPN